MSPWHLISHSQQRIFVWSILITSWDGVRASQRDVSPFKAFVSALLITKSWNATIALREDRILRTFNGASFYAEE